MPDLLTRLAHEGHWNPPWGQWPIRVRQDPDFVYLALEYGSGALRVPTVFGTLDAALESFADGPFNERWADAAKITDAPWYLGAGPRPSVEIEPGTLWWPLDAYGERMRAPTFMYNHPYILKTRIRR